MGTSPLQGLVWRLIGPFRGGRVVAVAGDPNDLATFYFGSTGGGVWKTTSGGQYWRNVSDGYFKRASVGAITVAPSDPNVIYVGMGETTIRGNVSHGDGVYKSTDAGRGWTHLGLEATRNIAKVKTHPANSDLVYVAALGHAHGANPERGLYRSDDGGKNWDLALSQGEDAGACDLALDPTNPRVVFAAFWNARRGPHYLNSGGPGSGLFRSNDGGATWEDLTEKRGMPKGPIGKIGIAPSAARSGRVWGLVEAEEGGVFRSDDGGETWERLNEDRNLRQRAWYYSHIYADPTDENTVWVLNVEMFRSVDSGKTFEQVPAPHGDNHDLWIDPANPKRMILGNDGGGTVSYNGGVSWSSLYNQPTAEMYHVTTDGRLPYRVYGAQQDNTTMSVPGRSNHDAITLTEYYEIGGGESGYIAVRPDNPNVIYAGSYQGHLTRYDHATGQLRSIMVWPEEYSGSGAKDYKYRFNWTSPTILSPHDPNIIYTGGNHVFRSTDDGGSWEEISPDLTRNDPATLEPSGGPITKDNTGAENYGTVFTIAESAQKAGVLWIGSDDGLVHVSRDKGKQWENVTPPTLPEWALISIVEASPHDPAAAYLAATRYKHDDFQPYLFKTADYGKSWTKITNGITENDFTRVIREDPSRRGLLYAGTETGIYASFDDGAHWRRLGGNLPVVPIHDFVVVHDDLVVGTHGRSFWVLDDLTTLRQMAEDSGTPSETTRLLKPRDTRRFSRLKGFGSKPVAGQNFTFAAGMIPAYDYEKTPLGEEKRTYLDAGQNLPDGVIVYYQIAAEPKEPITLAFLDSSGNELRTITQRTEATDDAEKKAKKAFPGAEEELDEPDKDPFLPAGAGLNRFVWDMQLPRAAQIVVKGGDKPDRSGPRVPPGEYQVRLTVDGETFTETFRIVPDPRIDTPQADFEAQFALLARIREKHDELNRAVNDLRRVKRQAAAWTRWSLDADGGSRVADAAKALTDKLEAVEGELLQTKIQSEQDSLNYPVKLNAKLATLGGLIASADATPTKQQQEFFEDLVARIDAQLATLQKVIKADVKAFNKQIADAGVPAVGG
ncbi:MAG: glycosyl hydrolase [Thermomicrobiales bacterium]